MPNRHETEHEGEEEEELPKYEQLGKIAFGTKDFEEGMWGVQRFMFV